MKTDLFPVGTRRELQKYKLKPVDEYEINKFKEYVSNFENQRKKMIKEFKNCVKDFNISKASYENVNLPEDDKKHVKLRLLGAVSASYNNYLFRDEDILDDFNQRVDIEREDQLRKSLKVEKVDYKKGKVLVYTSIGDEPIKFDIIEFYMPEDKKDDLIFSYKDLENLSEEERIEVLNKNNNISLAMSEQEMVESLNETVNRDQYSNWELTGTNRSFSQVRKEQKVYEEIEDYYKEASSLDEFIISLVGHLTDHEATFIYMLLSDNLKDYNTILYNYSLINSEIIDFIIENFNLNYSNIPQAGKIILSKDNLSFKNNRFVNKFKNKNSLTKKDRKKIFKEIGVKKEKLDDYSNLNYNYYYKELEKLIELKRKNKLTGKEIKTYCYSPYLSDLTEDNIIDLIKEGRKIKNHLPEEIEIRYNSPINEKYTPSDLKSQKRI